MSKIKFIVEYDGTNYCGWQKQFSPPLPSIQGHLEEFLEKLFVQPVKAVAAGRTDAGVHAIGQVVHFDAPKDPANYNFIHASQALLPPDITIREAKVVSDEFHAQRSAVAKTYIYKILNEPTPSALKARSSLWIRKPLNLDRLNEACQYLIGTRDFNAFRSDQEEAPDLNTIRTITEAKFLKTQDFIEFHITGSGFMKQMVRNIAGTLLQIEFGQRTVDSLIPLMESKDRRKAGPTLPPQGLFLKKVFYPPHLDN